jgi:hypothetical protein
MVDLAEIRKCCSVPQGSDEEAAFCSLFEQLIASLKAGNWVTRLLPL